MPKTLINTGAYYLATTARDANTGEFVILLETCDSGYSPNDNSNKEQIILQKIEKISYSGKSQILTIETPSEIYKIAQIHLGDSATRTPIPNQTFFDQFLPVVGHG